jgi:hypothetical protein
MTALAVVDRIMAGAVFSVDQVSERMGTTLLAVAFGFLGLLAAAW